MCIRENLFGERDRRTRAPGVAGRDNVRRSIDLVYSKFVDFCTYAYGGDQFMEGERRFRPKASRMTRVCPWFSALESSRIHTQAYTS